MEKQNIHPETSTILFNDPNDCIYCGPCRMSVGESKVIARGMRQQDYIFEDLMTGKTFLFSNHPAGTWDACGRDVLLITYYRQKKNLLGKIVPDRWLIAIVAVVGMNNGHIATDTKYSFWVDKVSKERKIAMARVVNDIYDYRTDWISYFNNNQIDENTEYA